MGSHMKTDGISILLPHWGSGMIYVVHDVDLEGVSSEYIEICI